MIVWNPMAEAASGSLIPRSKLKSSPAAVGISTFKGVIVTSAWAGTDNKRPQTNNKTNILFFIITVLLRLRYNVSLVISPR
jgi:hypothetical protein